MGKPRDVVQRSSQRTMRHNLANYPTGEFHTPRKLFHYRSAIIIRRFVVWFAFAAYSATAAKHNHAIRPVLADIMILNQILPDGLCANAVADVRTIYFVQLLLTSFAINVGSVAIERPFMLLKYIFKIRKKNQKERRLAFKFNRI